jgi:hypothetical protein
MRASSLPVTAVTGKSPRGVVLMLLLPPPNQRGVYLIFTSRVGHRLTGFDLTAYLKRELAGQLTAFESQSSGLLSQAKEA